MLDWLKKRVRADRTDRDAERRAIELVYEVFGPNVEDVTTRRLPSRRAA